jgi:protein-disulfide isomerase
VPAPPPVRAKGTRQASPRTLAIAGGVVVLIAAAVVLAVVLTGGSKKSSTSTLPTTGSLVNALPGAASVHAEFKGIRQSGLFLGSAAAPVRLVEYIDPQCPFCQQFETQAMPGLVDKYVRTGKVEVEERVLAFIGSDSLRGRNAIFAASFQNHAFDLTQLFYDNQGTENTGWLSDAMVAQAASSIPGVNPRRLVEESTSDGIVTLGNRVNQLAKADKITATPTILVGKTGARPKQVAMKSPTDGASVEAAIEAALS